MLFGYNKFLIIGSARTGTTFLQTLLASHDQISSHGEIFHLIANKQRLVEIVTDPIQYMKRSVFGSYPEYIKAVGFKGLYQELGSDNVFLGDMGIKNVSPDVASRRSNFMTYRDSVLDINQARRGMDAVLKYLSDDKEIRIIHLKRLNKLSTLLSNKLAEQSDVWTSESGSYLSKTVKLDLGECHRFFRNIEEREGRYDRLFQEHPVLQITYESIIADTDNESKKIQEFLGVDYHVMQTLLRRQNRAHVSKIIENFNELKYEFSSTPWSRYFED